MTNILISVDGTAKLVDFGLAGILTSRFRHPAANGHFDVERTVEYAGLERATSVEHGDTRSDIFFLGCVTYEMITGRPPLRKPKDRHDRMSSSRFSHVPELTREDVVAPKSLFHLVATMMAFSPKRRYQTPWQLLDAVKAARRDLEGNSPESDQRPNRQTLFVVEGDANLQITLRERLPKLGYRLLMASHPSRALDQYRHQPYDALLVDAGTAKQEGLHIFEQVQGEAERRGRVCAGLIVLSPEQAAWRQQIAERPQVAVLVRPFTLRALTSTLEQLLPPAR
jgi:eukaryotic-like serine/threonine-protein kinase